ncbi:MAG TPA: hypothetical protein ENI62_15685 [Gammaproteobacteria bacterium]|nr:hypothetical protein [Gammaproteobacteria bacterium]
MELFRLKALKLYRWSFREEGAFHEAVTNQTLSDLAGVSAPLFMHLTGKFNVRGGIYATRPGSIHVYRLGAPLITA